MSDLKLRQKLAKELRRLRTLKKMTQEEVAEKADISHRYYQILESDTPNRSATMEILDRLGKVFGKKFLNL